MRKEDSPFRTLRRELEQTLKPGRYEHTLGVAYTAANLAFVHGADVEKALLAGLLHDCAKGLSEEALIRLCREQHLPVRDAEAVSPALLHAKAGAFLARERYGVRDEEVLNAIRSHTTGRPAMTLLEKIIFTADFIEPHRRMLPEMDVIRREAYADLDRCVLHILRCTLDYLREAAKALDPMTEETYAYYLRLTQDK